MAQLQRFLVVDDSHTMRRIVVNLLKDAGFTDIGEAADGVLALEKLRATTFDFVICDINMPHMNGMQLLAEIKQDAALGHLPVLMVTAEARKQDILQAASLGAAGYVVKPFTRTVLESKVLLILGKLAK